MHQMPRADDAVEVAVDRTVAGGLGRRGTPHGSFRRFLRGFIHFLSYHLILARQNTRVTRAAGFRLTIRPTGKITKASYRFSDRMVTVRTPFGSKTAHVGGHTPERLARTLLRELVGKENA